MFLADLNDEQKRAFLSIAKAMSEVDGVNHEEEQALVGSVAGYMVASDAFQSTMAILEEARRLGGEEARRQENLAEECIEAMDEQRRQVLAVLEEIDERRNDWLRMLELYAPR